MEIISKFKEKPKEKNSYWALYAPLLVIAWLAFMPLFSLVIAPRIGIRTDNGMPIPFIIFLLGGLIALIVFALTTAIKTYKKGERSWVVIIGTIITALITFNALFFIVGEFIFPE